MNENKHNSCHSSSENILIEQSFNSSVTPKPTCNRRLLFCSWLLFRCTTTTTKRHSNCNGLSQTNFTKTKASRINLQREIKKTRFDSSVRSRRFQSSAATAADFLCLIAPALSLENFSSSSSPTLLFFAYFIFNQFGFTEYNCGLLQNAIQQPQFCLFTDLLVLVGYHLIAY